MRSSFWGDSGSMIESGEPLERVCELCVNTYCLGTFIHSWVCRKWIGLLARKEDGSPFPPRSIKLILSGLQRHMRAEAHHYSTSFKRMITVFEILGQLVTPFSRNYLPTELEHLWNTTQIFHTRRRQTLKSWCLWDCSPSCSPECCFFYVGKYLCLRGGEEHRNLTRSQFIDMLMASNMSNMVLKPSEGV